MDKLDIKMLDAFPGKCVRKDLTSSLKRNANVPAFVLEYLLGMCCASADEAVIEAGMTKIRSILNDNYVHPEESERIKSIIREKGEHTIIDKINVRLDEHLDIYVASFTNLNIDPFEIQRDIVTANAKVLSPGGLWCLVKIAYSRHYGNDEKSHKRRDPRESPFRVVTFKPIQLPAFDINEIVSQRRNFTNEEWMDMLLRSEGLEPSLIEDNAKMHFIERMVPLVERNYNLCELGPRGTGKSHLYKEISPYSILVSGGQSTSANLFYNIARRQVGLVCNWDCVAFDEIAGMHFKDHDAVQIMKDYMASGSFARGRENINAEASMVFIGNINESVHNLQRTSHLFQPFPDEFNNDSAFFDRMHYYLPGWSVPVMKSEIITKNFGLITDCLAEFTRGMRKQDFTHLIDQHFKLNSSFSTRDETAVRKTFSGLAKLLYPDQIMTKAEMKALLDYAIEGRRRVKEQLRVMAGNEFADVNLGYVDGDKTFVVTVSEKTTEYIIPEKALPSGHIFAAGNSLTDGSSAVYRLENKLVPGTGRLTEAQGVGTNRKVKESINAAWMYFKTNAKEVSPAIKPDKVDCLLNFECAQNKLPSVDISLAEFIGLCGAALDIPVMEATVFVGELKVTGTVGEIHDLTNILKASRAAGARKIFLPMSCISSVMNVPEKLLKSISPIYYVDPVDAAKKALDIY